MLYVKRTRVTLNLNADLISAQELYVAAAESIYLATPYNQVVVSVVFSQTNCMFLTASAFIQRI